ncbi:hypothetical protein K438DRAFT_1776646 [Mycena galopus ATCC 62051]|nr:hypothetical protein K438DRAFT_1776646 [Mycena galopus ATCC 62051]
MLTESTDLPAKVHEKTNSQLLSEKWSSYIHDYSSIASNLGIICPSATVIALLMGGLSFMVDPSEILRSFLQAVWVSCRVQFNKAKASFHPQMLAWASTGCPSVELVNILSVDFSTFGCTEYHPETIQRETVPLTLQDAINKWLLTEILGSIGDFSIL